MCVTYLPSPKVKVSHSVLMSEALAAKVQQLELQLMSLSYGAEDCQALAIVHAEIQNQARNHRAVLEQVRRHDVGLHTTHSSHSAMNDVLSVTTFAVSPTLQGLHVHPRRKIEAIYSDLHP